MQMMCEVGRKTTRCDHIRVYQQDSDKFWAIASQQSECPGVNAATATCPQVVGRGGLVGYVALTGMDMRVADVKSSAAYDPQLDDILVEPNVHCVHQALVVRCARGKANHSVLIKAMRGWETPGAEFIQDDRFLLRCMAQSASKVRPGTLAWSQHCIAVLCLYTCLTCNPRGRRVPQARNTLSSPRASSEQGVEWSSCQAESICVLPMLCECSVLWALLQHPQVPCISAVCMHCRRCSMMMTGGMRWRTRAAHSRCCAFARRARCCCTRTPSLLPQPLRSQTYAARALASCMCCTPTAAILAFKRTAPILTLPRRCARCLRECSDVILRLRCDPAPCCDTRARSVQVRPLASSLLKHCFTSKQPVVCNSTRTDTRYYHNVDGLLPEVKVMSTLLVPLTSDSGATIGVLQVCMRPKPRQSHSRFCASLSLAAHSSGPLWASCHTARIMLVPDKGQHANGKRSDTSAHTCQVHNKRHTRPCSRLSDSEPAGFCSVDVKAAMALAAELWQAKAAAEAFQAVQEQGNPLEHVPSIASMADMHAKAQYMLKDALGVTQARVVMVDHARQQLRVTGERSDAFYPLTARSLLARVLQRGALELLRKPGADPDFNAAIDANGSPGPEDMLLVPVPAAPDIALDISRPPSSHSAASSGCQQSRTGSVAPGQIIAVIQVRAQGPHACR
jgi:hypothetical protein